MNIPIAKPYLDGTEERAVIDVLRSGWISQGPRCAEFERAIARFIGVKHGRAVNSGTSAIELVLLALGIGTGDEVIVPAFTCVATLNPLVHIGAHPVPVDIEPESFGLDPVQVAAALTRRTKAIVVVHLFGLAARVEPLLQLAATGDLLLVEDLALGLGAKIGERAAGSFGSAACLSFHPRKMLTTGEGGMAITDSDEVASQIAELRNYGASVAAWQRHSSRLFCLPEYEQAGFNFKMTDIQAAMGLEQVNKLQEMLRLRREIAARYDVALAGLDWLALPLEPIGRTHSYQSYVCTVQLADLDAAIALRLRLWQHLAQAGIASVQGAQDMSTVAYYRHRYGWQPGDFQHALRADRTSVALPIYPGLTEVEQAYVIDTMLAFRP